MITTEGESAEYPQPEENQSETRDQVGSVENPTIALLTENMTQEYERTLKELWGFQKRSDYEEWRRTPDGAHELGAAVGTIGVVESVLRQLGQRDLMEDIVKRLRREERSHEQHK